MEEFTIYDGDLNVKLEITEEKKNKVFERIIQYCKEHNCTDGEHLHQSDNCILDAPNVLSDIIDNIMDFQVKWNPND